MYDLGLLGMDCFITVNSHSTAYVSSRLREFMLLNGFFSYKIETLIKKEQVFKIIFDINDTQGTVWALDKHGNLCSACNNQIESRSRMFLFRTTKDNEFILVSHEMLGRRKRLPEIIEKYRERG